MHVEAHYFRKIKGINKCNSINTSSEICVYFLTIGQNASDLNCSFSDVHATAYEKRLSSILFAFY